MALQVYKLRRVWSECFGKMSLMEIRGLRGGWAGFEAGWGPME
jgi:hypothetical protein